MVEVPQAVEAGDQEVDGQGGLADETTPQGGQLLVELGVGQEVRLVYGNGKVEYFVITEILRYQALEPNSQLSSFRSLDHSEILSAEQMFKRVYAGERHVTFQTCIAANGTVSWGRLFVVAEPKQFSFDHLVEQILQ